MAFAFGIINATGKEEETKSNRNHNQNVLH